MIKPKLLAGKKSAYILLHLIFFIYSISALCFKLAAARPFLSFYFLLLYSFAVGLLFIYAIVWQQILKRLPLSTAYMNKAAVIAWGMIWGSLIFKEKITVFMLIGAAVIFIGVLMVVKADG